MKCKSLRMKRTNNSITIDRLAMKFFVKFAWSKRGCTHNEQVHPKYIWFGQWQWRHDSFIACVCSICFSAFVCLCLCFWPFYCSLPSSSTRSNVVNVIFFFSFCIQIGFFVLFCGMVNVVRDFNRFCIRARWAGLIAYFFLFWIKVINIHPSFSSIIPNLFKAKNWPIFHFQKQHANKSFKRQYSLPLRTCTYKKWHMLVYSCIYLIRHVRRRFTQLATGSHTPNSWYMPICVYYSHTQYALHCLLFMQETFFPSFCVTRKYIEARVIYYEEEEKEKIGKL